MNKFTLRFQHQDLEENYQKTRLQVRKQVFYGMAISYLSMNTMAVILNTISGKEVYWYMDAAIITVALSTIALVTYKNKYICQGLCIMNFIASLIQIGLSETNTNQVTYIFGANIMGTQLMLLIGCDFVFSLVQLILIITLRLGILAFYYPLDWFSIALTLIVSFWLGVYQYESDHNLRMQFLLRIKENHWDQSLPSMIGRPFLYFEYDTQFNVKTAFREQEILTYNSEFCSSCNLRTFLREFKYKNQTLENFILYRIKIRQPPYSGLEIIGINKKNVKISFIYSEMFSDTNTFVIIFNPQPKKHNLLKENYTSFQKLLLTYTHYLVKILASKKSFGRKQIELNVHFLSALYLNDDKIDKYSPTSLIRQIARLFKLQVYSLFEDEIYGYKNKFIIFWIEMMAMISKSQHSLEQPHIYLKADQKQLLIILSLQSPSQFNYLYQRNKIVQKLKKKLFFEINELRWMFKLYIDLDVTFNSYYLKQ